MHTHSPGTQEAEAGGLLLSSGQAQAIQKASVSKTEQKHIGKSI